MIKINSTNKGDYNKIPYGEVDLPAISYIEDIGLILSIEKSKEGLDKKVKYKIRLLNGGIDYETLKVTVPEIMTISQAKETLTISTDNFSETLYNIIEEYKKLGIIPSKLIEIDSINKNNYNNIPFRKIDKPSICLIRDMNMVLSIEQIKVSQQGYPRYKFRAIKNGTDYETLKFKLFGVGMQFAKTKQTLAVTTTNLSETLYEMVEQYKDPKPFIQSN